MKQKYHTLIAVALSTVFSAEVVIAQTPDSPAEAAQDCAAEEVSISNETGNVVIASANAAPGAATMANCGGMGAGAGMGGGMGNAPMGAPPMGAPMGGGMAPAPAPAGAAATTP